MQQQDRGNINGIIEGLHASLKRIKSGIIKFKVKEGFLWKLFKTGKRLSELSDLSEQLTIKIKEIKVWFKESLSKTSAGKDTDTVVAAMHNLTVKSLVFPLEDAVNKGWAEAEASTEEEQANAMKVNEDLIVAAGVPEYHMEGELKFIKDILKRFEKKKKQHERTEYKRTFFAGTTKPNDAGVSSTKKGSFVLGTFACTFTAVFQYLPGRYTIQNILEEGQLLLCRLSLLS